MYKLYVWSPALDLHSIDPQCLMILCYLRMLGIDFTIIECNDPNVSPTCELPLLNDGMVWISGTDRIIAHLKKNGYNGNDKLTNEQSADYLAYNSLIQDRLYDCLLFTWYFDTENYIHTIRPIYSHLLPFPLRYIIPSQLRRAAKSRLSLYNLELRDTEPGDNKGLETTSERLLLDTGYHRMYRFARECYKAIRTRLHDKPFFFGTECSTIDAALYAHLYTHWRPALRNPRLSKIIVEEFPELITYINMIHNKYMVDLPRAKPEAENLSSFWMSPSKWTRMIWGEMRERLESIKGEKKEKSEAEKQFERKRVWAIAGGIAFMVIYVVINGIVRIEFVEESDGDDKDEELDPETENDTREVLEVDLEELESDEDE